ncbi:MAG: nucleotidyltransferase, partial [bacterium]
LTEVVETRDIVKVPGGAAVNGLPVDGDGYVSMNMWGFPSAAFMDVLDENFRCFFAESVPSNPLKAEYLLPVLIGRLLSEGKLSVRVLPTPDVWYGVTYAEDRAAVAQSIGKLIADGAYQPDLYGDLARPAIEK